MKKLCYVLYYDHKLNNEIWEEEEKAKKKSGRSICEAGGLILGENDDELILTISAGACDDRKNVLDVFTICKACIIKKVEIPESYYRQELPDNPKQKIDWY